MRPSAAAALAAAALLLAGPAEAAVVVGIGSARNASVLADARKDRALQLRVCNAYGFESGLHVCHRPQHAISALTPAWASKDEEEELTKDSGPLAYGHCKDLGSVHDLGTGSQLSFRLSAGDNYQVGAFVIRGELPPPGSLLQVVIFRSDPETTSASFISHAFRPFDNLADPEVALVDTFRDQGNSGDGGASLELSERGMFASPAERHERIEFGRVITLRPGTYEWVLLSPTTAMKRFAGYSPTPKERLARTSRSCATWLQSGQHYTVIRIGNNAKMGPYYPEDVVAFPERWSMCGSASERSTWAATALALVLALSATRPAT